MNAMVQYILKTDKLFEKLNFNQFERQGRLPSRLLGPSNR